MEPHGREAAPVDGASRERRVARGVDAIAGAVGAGAAFATAYLLGAFDRLPDLLTEVGDVVVIASPQAVVHWAIATFGQADKLVLRNGIVVVGLIAGAAVAVLARGRLGWLVAGFGAFGAVGVLAAWRDPAIGLAGAAIAAVLAVAVGVVATSWVRGSWARSPSAGSSPVPERRAFLRAAGMVAVYAAAATTAGWTLTRRAAESAARRLSLVLPRPAEPLPPVPATAAAPVPDVSPPIVPNERFYRIDTALVVPRVDPETWTLAVRGLVEEPYTIGLAELLDMPLVERDVTLVCVSNEIGGALAGNARWLGVPLHLLLERAGLAAGAEQVVGRSVDGFTVGFPVGAALDGRTALVAVGMNGEPLPVEHGFPARLVVAGLYGYVSATKWLSEIELTTWDGFDAYWIPRGWSKEGPIKTASRIDVPQDGRALAAGEIAVGGVAWAPGRGIEAVEVRADGGPWSKAELAAPLGADAWRPWWWRWRATPGRHVLEVRAIDGTGAVQPPGPRPPRPDGAEGYHKVAVTVSA